jgi:Flp pilus assembly protein TadD
MRIRFWLAVTLLGSCLALCADESADIDLLINARLQIRNGDLEQAEQSTRDFVAKHPESAQAHFLLGFIFFREGQTKAETTATQEKVRLSLAEYTEGAKHHAPSSLDLKIVALDYVLLGDFADADRWLTRSLNWNPKDAEAWYDLGRIKDSENDYSAAIQAFDRCLQLDPQYTHAADAKKRAEVALKK